MRGLYALCETEEIPITAHASPGNEFALGYGEMAAPARWAPVLREFPNLRLNFGHFGHETGADGAEGIEARDAWMRQAAELIETHAHVYADLSSSPLVYDAAYAARFGAHLQALCARFRRLPSRLMYGSDWWLNRFDPRGETAVDAFQRFLADVAGTGARRDHGPQRAPLPRLPRRGRSPGGPATATSSGCARSTATRRCRRGSADQSRRA